MNARHMLITSGCFLLVFVGFIRTTEGQDFEYIDGHKQSTQGLSMTLMEQHIYVGGTIEPESWLYSAPYLVKMSTSGDTLWTQTLDHTGNDQDQLVDLVATAGNELGLLSQIGRGIRIQMISIGGEEMWRYDDESLAHPVALVNVKDGLVACATCESDDYNNGEPSICLIKTDKKGKRQWMTRVGEGERIKPYGLKASSDGKLIVIAKRRLNGQEEVFLSFVSQKGKSGNETSLSDIDIDEAFALDVDEQGNLLIAGQGKSSAVPVLVKLDAKGKLIWEMLYEGEPGNYRAYDIGLDRDGGYVLVGRTRDARGFTIKTNSKGKQQWIKHFSGIEKAGFNRVAISDHGYVVSGLTLKRNDNKLYVLGITFE